MSFNIRCNTPGDGEDAWPRRADRAASVLRVHRPDVAGLQEARPEQVADLARRLPDYAWLGVGRDDGQRAGEFAPIFYRAARLTLLEKSTFWLSKTPEVPGSINWKACCTRIVTWARFLDRATGWAFLLFNTHFDQISAKARRKAAGILLERVPALAGGAPVLLTGDLNCTEASKPYRKLTQPASDGAFAFQDAMRVSETPHHGPTATYHAFSGAAHVCIDYIFVAQGWRVLCHATLPDHWDGRYPSDHFPILADLVCTSTAGSVLH